jgi:hypothetical protein
MDSGVLGHPEALLIGSISSNNDDNALSLVTLKFYEIDGYYDDRGCTMPAES